MLATCICLNVSLTNYVALFSTCLPVQIMSVCLSVCPSVISFPLSRLSLYKPHTPPQIIHFACERISFLVHFILIYHIIYFKFRLNM